MSFLFTVTVCQQPTDGHVSCYPENVSRAATVNVHARSTSDRIADEFRRRGYKNVKAFPAVGFEEWASRP